MYSRQDNSRRESCLPEGREWGKQLLRLSIKEQINLSSSQNNNAFKKVARDRHLFLLVIYKCQLVGLVGLLAKLAEFRADNSNVSFCILM